MTNDTSKEVLLSDGVGGSLFGCSVGSHEITIKPQFMINKKIGTNAVNANLMQIANDYTIRKIELLCVSDCEQINTSYYKVVNVRPLHHCLLSTSLGLARDVATPIELMQSINSPAAVKFVVEGFSVMFSEKSNLWKNYSASVKCPTNFKRDDAVKLMMGLKANARGNEIAVKVATQLLDSLVILGDILTTPCYINQQIVRDMT